MNSLTLGSHRLDKSPENTELAAKFWYLSEAVSLSALKRGKQGNPCLEDVEKAYLTGQIDAEGGQAR
ncbi:MAG: hypothetical protein Q8N90_01285 [bacterium]|nr:hypothetical protein [bacterium]